MAAPSLRATVGWVLRAIDIFPSLAERIAGGRGPLNLPPEQAGDLAQAAVFRKRALVGTIHSPSGVGRPYGRPLDRASRDRRSRPQGARVTKSRSGAIYRRALIPPMSMRGQAACTPT